MTQKSLLMSLQLSHFTSAFTKGLYTLFLYLFKSIVNGVNGYPEIVLNHAEEEIKPVFDQKLWKKSLGDLASGIQCLLFPATQIHAQV